MVKQVLGQALSRMSSFGSVHTFKNGIKVYRSHLIPKQKKRYHVTNLHEPKEEELFLSILSTHRQEAGIFVDVGAALGYYCFLVRKLVPDIEIHAFNPDKLFVDMMKKNMQLNEMLDMNIHEEALSNRPGKCSLPPGSYGARIGPGDTINVTTIDDFLSQMESNVFLMKMDIQGEEVNALMGATESFTKIKNIVVGTHGSDKHDSCLDILESHEYKITFESPKVAGQPDGIIVGKK